MIFWAEHVSEKGLEVMGTVIVKVCIKMEELKQTSQELQMLSSVTLIKLLGHKDYHEVRFSIVRILISVSNVTSL